MKYSIFNENDWLFPDSKHNDKTAVNIDIARNGHSGFSVLGDLGVKYCVANVNVVWKSDKGPVICFYELKSVGVDENPLDFDVIADDCKQSQDFVTRKTPFKVYDALSPLNYFKEDRLAIFCEIYAPPGLPAGVYVGEVYVSVNGKCIIIPIRCAVHKATVPYLKRSRLSIMNLFSFENIASQHDVKMGGKVYCQLYAKYVRMMLKFRCTHIPLPKGEPIYDQSQKLIGFDFSLAQALGKIALKEGAPFLTGAGFANFNKQDELSYFPFWNSQLSLFTLEGYLQLRLYLTEWARVIKRNGWKNVITQSIVDEPQVHSDTSYCVISTACRKFLPGVKIIEAVEAASLAGGADVYVPKQDEYEKHRKEFEGLKSAGEELWFCSGAASAGKMMNRCMSLPLAASRELLWMGFGYGLTGFLHWGFNSYTGEDIWNKACSPYKGTLLPAGDAHIVYPEHLSKNSDDVLMSMRLHVQRCGAEDYELFTKLYEYNPKEAVQIQQAGCKSFEEYESDGVLLSQAHKRLLEALDEYLTE